MLTRTRKKIIYAELLKTSFTRFKINSIKPVVIVITMVMILTVLTIVIITLYQLKFKH